MRYQKINIGSVNISGIDRMPDYRQIFRKKPIGKSILDIGCNMGFYSLQAASEGASRVTGIDTSEKALQYALSAKKELGYKNVKFINGDIFSVKLNMYDIVLCLNFLHHMAPMKKLKKLLGRIDRCSVENMFFTITPFKSAGGVFYKEEINHNGLLKMRLVPGFFEKHWPMYKTEYEPSKTFNGRILVKVKK